MLVRLCRQLTGARLVPVRVRTHRRDDKHSELVEFFGVKLNSVHPLRGWLLRQDMAIVSADHHLTNFDYIL